MASQKLTAFLKENKQTISNFANFIIDNAVPAIAALGSAFVAMKVGQFATMIAKSAIGLRGFIGALKNGQFATTIAKCHRFARFHRRIKEWAVDHGAFNAVAGLNPFTIIAVAIAAVAHWYFTGKVHIFGQA